MKERLRIQFVDGTRRAGVMKEHNGEKSVMLRDVIDDRGQVLCVAHERRVVAGTRRGTGRKDGG